MRRALAMGLALAGCGRGGDGTALASGLEGSVASELARCASLEGSASSDWCAVETLTVASESNGELMAQICPRLGDVRARDVCLEAAVRHQTRPADAATCDGINDEMTRSSCRLAVADRSLHGELAEAIDACKTTEILVFHCASHIVEARAGLWPRGGAPVMSADVATLLAAFPGLEAWKDFGSSVGAVALSLDLAPGEAHPCGVIPPGVAYDQCDRAAHGDR